METQGGACSAAAFASLLRVSSGQEGTESIAFHGIHFLPVRPGVWVATLRLQIRPGGTRALLTVGNCNRQKVGDA